MSSFLKYEEYLPLAPKEVGKQINVHHCKQGRNNDRMYIKREALDTVVAYCHHCGKKGKHTDNKFVKNIYDFETTDDSTGVKKVLLPYDTNFDIREWPTIVKLWPLKYGITLEEIKSNGIGYSKYYSSIVLPIYDTSTRLLGVTRRYFNRKETEGETRADDSSIPKYVKVLEKHGRHLHLLKAPDDTLPRESNCIVLVEDLLSGIKCARVMDCGVLNGTSILDKDLAYISKNYDEAIIFLDDDNAMVRANMLKYKRIFDLTLPKGSRIIRTSKDPKEYETQELKGILI